MFQAFLELEVAEVVGAELVAQESGELFVLFEESVFPVSAEDVMAVLDLLQGGVQLAGQAAGDAGAEDFRDLLGRETPQTQLATALEEAMDGEVAFEDEIAAVLDLTNSIEAPQVHGGPHDHRSQYRIAEVEVVMSEAAALPGQDTVMRVAGRVLGGGGTES